MKGGKGKGNESSNHSWAKGVRLAFWRESIFNEAGGSRFFPPFDARKCRFFSSCSSCVSLSLCLSIFGEEMKIFERASYIFISVSTSVESNLFGSGGGENERRGEKKEGGKRKKGILLNLIEAWILFRITLKLNRMRFNLGDRSRFYDWIS